MVGCGLPCPGGGGAGVSGCEFRGSGWGWDRRCQDLGAQGLGRSKFSHRGIAGFSLWFHLPGCSI